MTGPAEGQGVIVEDQSRQLVDKRVTGSERAIIRQCENLVEECKLGMGQKSTAS